MATDSMFFHPFAEAVIQGAVDPVERGKILSIRRTVLTYFGQRSRPDHIMRRRWEANGDVVCDILLAHRHKLRAPPGEVSHDARDIVQYLYGVSDLLKGAEYPVRINRKK